MERRLAAILVADVVGYSCLLGADEEGTLAHLKVHRDEVIHTSIDTHSRHTGSEVRFFSYLVRW